MKTINIKLGQNVYTSNYYFDDEGYIYADQLFDGDKDITQIMDDFDLKELVEDKIQEAENNRYLENI